MSTRFLTFKKAKQARRFARRHRIYVLPFLHERMARTLVLRNVPPSAWEEIERLYQNLKPNR